MSLSIYQILIPTFIHTFENLSNILKKGADHATAKKFDPSILINARLAPDMFALVRQVQIATDVAKGGAARLAGIEVPSFLDDETTFEQLQARIEKLIDFLKSVPADKINGSQERSISLKVGGKELNFSGQDYLLNFVIPNIYFHVTATYAILRHNGVNLGKGDFLGAI